MNNTKKTILVISLDGPDYDKSTASRMTYHYLKLFVDMGLQVVFGGFYNQRLEPYATELEQLGIQVLHGEEENGLKHWIKQHGRNLDYAYIIFPFIAEVYLGYLKKYTRAKIFYNASDLFFLREIRNYRIKKDPELLKSAFQWKSKEMDIFKQVDVIHVVSAYEAEIISRMFPMKKVRCIPVCMYEMNMNKNEIVSSYENRKGLLFVGAFTHKPNIDGVLWFITHVFPSIISKQPDTKLYIVGNKPTKEIIRTRSRNIVVTGFVTDAQLKQLYRNSRVVIAPLRFGAGVKGKVVEAMYHQVPVVTTSMGSEGLLKINKYVSIAEEPATFAEEVLQVYQNKKAWMKRSARSYNYIKKYFTMNAGKKQLELDL